MFDNKTLPYIIIENLPLLADSSYSEYLIFANNFVVEASLS